MDDSTGKKDSLPQDASLQRERRKDERVGVVWEATLRTAQGYFDCIVLDVSMGGAKLLLTDPAILAQSAVLMIEHYGNFRAEVVWQHAEFAGIRFIDDPAYVARIFDDFKATSANPSKTPER